MAALTYDTGVASINGSIALTPQTMTTSDTFTYVSGARQTLILRNPGLASAVNVTLVGTAPATVDVVGYGTISTAAGKTISVPINGVVYLELDDIKSYLQGNGTVTVTSSLAGLIALLFTA